MSRRNKPIGLGVCSYCNGYTTSILTCDDCGRGFCFSCEGIRIKGVCYSCEQQQFREDHDLDWDWRDEEE